jgi:ubiquitin-like protein Pup
MTFARRRAPAARDQESAPAGTESKVDGEKLKKEMDDLLDEIDAALEENDAEAFVESYIQKGGQATRVASNFLGWIPGLARSATRKSLKPSGVARISLLAGAVKRLGIGTWATTRSILTSSRPVLGVALGAGSR